MPADSSEFDALFDDGPADSSEFDALFDSPEEALSFSAKAQPYGGPPQPPYPEIMEAAKPIQYGANLQPPDAPSPEIMDLAAQGEREQADKLETLKLTADLERRHTQTPVQEGLEVLNHMMARNAGSTIGGLGGLGFGISTAASLVPGLGIPANIVRVGLPLLTAYMGGKLGGEVEEQGRRYFETPEDTEGRHLFAQQENAAHPYLKRTADMASVLPFFRPSPQQLLNTARGAGYLRFGLPLPAAERAALINTAAAGSIGAGQHAGVSALEGRVPTGEEIAESAATMALMNKPTRFGTAVGLGHPTIAPRSEPNPQGASPLAERATPEQLLIDAQLARQKLETFPETDPQRAQVDAEAKAKLEEYRESVKDQPTQSTPAVEIEALDPGEKITGAAVKVGDRVYTGVQHAEAVLKAEGELGDIGPYDPQKMGGYVTDKGRFVTRENAEKAASSVPTANPSELPPPAEATPPEPAPFSKIDSNFENGRATIEYKSGEDTVGAITANVKDGNLQVDTVLLNPDLRGKGLGRGLYDELLKMAKEKGLRVVSDRIVTKDAAKIYDRLERDGFEIARNPNVSQTPEGVLVSTDGKPVFEINGPRAVESVKPEPMPLPSAPMEESRAPEAVSTIKNAQTDIDTMAAALRPPGESPKRPWKEVEQEARKTEADSTGAGARLVKELAENPRPVSDRESMQMAIEHSARKERLKALNRAINEAVEKGDVEAVQRMQKDRDGLQEEFAASRDVNRAVGSRAGAGLNARKAFPDDPWDSPEMVENAQAELGRKLTEPEKQTIEDVRKKIDDALNNVEAATEVPPAPENASGKSFIERIDAIEKAAKERIRKRGGGYMQAGGLAGVPNSVDMVIVGAAKLARGVVNSARWAADMLADFGPSIRPHLPGLLALSKKQVAWERRQAKLAAKYNAAAASGKAIPRTAPYEPELSPVALQAMADVKQAKQAYYKMLHALKQRERGLGKRALDAIDQTRGLVKNLTASFDLSAPRQALAAILSNATRITKPGMVLRPFASMAKALVSENNARVIEQRIQNRPNARNGLDKRAGIEYSSLDEQTFTKQEENARSVLDELAERPYRTGNLAKTVAGAIPKTIAKGVRASNRAFITFLNKTRADLFDELLTANYHDRPPTTDELKAIGNLVNVMTGRGKMRPGTAEVLGRILWSPKLLASRLQLLTGQPFVRGSMRTRGIVAKEYARILTTGALLAAVNSLFDEKKERDTRSTDFGKIVLGDTRVDLWAGYQQVLTFLERERTGQSKSPTTNKTSNLRERTGGMYEEPIFGLGDTKTKSNKRTFGAGMMQTAGNFLRSKLAVDLGALTNIALRENMVGEKTTPKTVARDLLIPLSWRDVVGIAKDNGLPTALALQVASIFGAGVNKYEEPEKKPAAKPKAPLAR